MKSTVITLAILMSVSILALTGCSTNTQNQNTGVGAVAGAVVGGLAGSAIGAGTGRAVAIGVGAVAGALFGGYIGHSMDHSDNTSMNNVMNNNTKNKKSSWTNKKTGTHYVMKPTTKVMAYQGNNYCRGYRARAVTTSGKTENFRGVACRQTDGNWQKMSS